ncbi:hypothetical protein [Thermococcus peptonophilus]|uniref:Uncharacterized protein n=1 Tax=Thermococcus peptonophilus TaxID=53952 RepID=A0A142CVE6_9EURY|nr:hypothetical protein [Thermococcus peptonophilus]AMQ18748.1 hypothetical protein A0127_05970 [Thermococcus peptonophilus]
MIRELYLGMLFAITTYLTYIGFDEKVFLVLTLASALSFFFWGAGYAYLTVLGIVLVYFNRGGLYGLSLLSLAIIFVESVHLTRIRSPMRHYGMLFVAVMLAIPIYYIVQIISAYLPSLSNTTVAAFFIVSLYLTFYFVLRR